MASEWDRIAQRKKELYLPARMVGGARIVPKRPLDFGSRGLAERVEGTRGWEGKWNVLSSEQIEPSAISIAEYNAAFRRWFLDYSARQMNGEIREITHSGVLEHFEKIRIKLYHRWIDDMRSIPFHVRVMLARNMFNVDAVLTATRPLRFSHSFARAHKLFIPALLNDTDMRFSTLQDVVIFGFEALAQQWPMLYLTNDLRHYVECLHFRMCELGLRNFYVNEMVQNTRQRVMDYEPFLDQNTPPHIRRAGNDLFVFHHATYLSMQRCFVVEDRLCEEFRHIVEVPDIPREARDSAQKWLRKALTGSDGRMIADAFKDKFYSFFERPGMFDIYLARMIKDEQIVGTDAPRNSDHMYSAYNACYNTDATVIQKGIIDKTAVAVLDLPDDQPFVPESKLLYFLCAVFHSLFIQTRIDAWNTRWKERPRPREMQSAPVTFGRNMHNFFIYEQKERRLFRTTDEIAAAFYFVHLLEVHEPAEDIKEKIAGLRECIFERGTYQRKAVVKEVDSYKNMDAHVLQFIQK